MNRIEKVFQIPKGDGLYENIKISVEGEDTLDILTDIYTALYVDRLISFMLNDTGNEEVILELLTKVQNIKEKAKELIDAD